MANYGWEDLQLKIKQDTSSYTWAAIKTWVDTQDMPTPKAVLEDWHPKGQAWGEKKHGGSYEHDGGCTLEGLFDDTATTGQDAVLFASGAKIGALFHIAESYDGGTNWTVVRGLLESYKRLPKQKGLTRFQATFSTYGSILYTGTAPTGTTDPTYP